MTNTDRFKTALTALQECWENMRKRPEDDQGEETKARRKLIKLCEKIYLEYIDEVPPEAIHVLKLPTLFYTDRLERELPSGGVVEWGKKLTTVKLHGDEQLDEMESDAEYYADKEDGPDCISAGLRGSAQATLRRIKAYRKSLQLEGKGGEIACSTTQHTQSRT